MTGQVIEIVQRIGVFMILGETVIHFCPEQEYEKYIRLIMEMMLITMLIIPFITLIKTDVMESFRTELKAFETLVFSGKQELMQEENTESIIEEAFLEQTALELKESISECVEEMGYQVRRVELQEEQIVVYVKNANSKKTEIYIDPVEEIQIGIEDEVKAALEKRIAEILYVNQERIIVKG